MWLPWPLPHGWLVTGFAGAGDERSGLRGSAIALTGPHPLCGSKAPGGPETGGPADLVIVAEEPGIGLGAGLAGLAGPDPGDGFASGQPAAYVRVGHHEAPLWPVRSDHTAVFAGEVEGSWVWALVWPDSAGVLLLESLTLRDLRDTQQELDVPFGALSTRLPT